MRGIYPPFLKKRRISSKADKGAFMTERFDFKDEWKKTKSQLMKFSKEAVQIAKKGEKELIKFSKQSKLHLDSTTATLKKEHLYHLIGKEYASLKDTAMPSAKLNKLMNDLKVVEAQQKTLQAQIKQSKKQMPEEDNA